SKDRLALHCRLKEKGVLCTHKAVGDARRLTQTETDRYDAGCVLPDDHVPRFISPRGSIGALVRDDRSIGRLGSDLLDVRVGLRRSAPADAPSAGVDGDRAHGVVQPEARLIRTGVRRRVGWQLVYPPLLAYPCLTRSRELVDAICSANLVGSVRVE